MSILTRISQIIKHVEWIFLHSILHCLFYCLAREKYIFYIQHIVVCTRVSNKIFEEWCIYIFKTLNVYCNNEELVGVEQVIKYDCFMKTHKQFNTNFRSSWWDRSIFIALQNIKCIMLELPKESYHLSTLDVFLRQF